MPVGSDLYRKLPSVDDLLRTPALLRLAEREGNTAVADAVRVVLARVRNQITAGNANEVAVEMALAGLSDAVEQQLLTASSYSLRQVVNATGVILHTNLGRAPIANAALEHIRQAAGGYCNLEFDIAAGERGQRDMHLDRLFRKLFDDGLAALGAHPKPQLSTMVVNNNAAAVLVALNALAEGGEVIVSRGELVEIGGSFRVPEVMAKSGALLREVGSTNCTRVSDYERAISEKTRLLLKVHRSNFQITGFTEQPSRSQLTHLAHSRGLPVMEDLGSGALFDLRGVGIHGEPGVLESLNAEVDVVTFSGDKLLGGPQAGLLSGRHDLIARIRSNPLFRALRVDKLTYAALEATLLAYIKRNYDAIPAVRMMRWSAEEIGERAERLMTMVSHSRLHLGIVSGESVVGGGAAPSAVLPTRLISVTFDGHNADRLAASLRAGDPPVVARVAEGRVLLDLRTVFPEQEPLIVSALIRVAHSPSEE